MKPLLAPFSLLVLGCGSTTTPTAPHTPPPAAFGTTGYPRLDWGLDPGAVREAYPAALSTGETLTMRGQHEGRPAVTTFEFSDHKLIGISIAFDGAFSSMTECGKVWSVVRAALDPKLGQSAGENLGAFWESASSEIVLACNPNDDETASLAMHYAQHVAD